MTEKTIRGLILELNSNDEKKALDKKILDYYEKKIDIVLKQNNELRKYALDTSANSGIIDTYLTRGIFRSSFSNPREQTIMAEEMANEGYFSLALKQFTSLCKSVNVKLGYKSKHLENNTHHKKVIEFVEIQINKIGGYEILFDKIVYPALRWGVGIAIPELTLTGKNKDMVGFNKLKTINLQNVKGFYFDANDTSRVKVLKYITFPKAIEIDNINDPYSNINEDTPVSLISIDIEKNCIAYHAHNALDGNPFGTFYLYYLYSYYKQHKKLSESLYNALHSFGTYPMGVRRTSRDSGADNTQWEMEATSKLFDLMSEGGGLYVDGEGELYTIDAPDTEKMVSSMEMLFDTVMRTSSLGQITTGIKGGGSRDLMRSLDIFTDSFVLATVKKAYLDISETMIRNLCELNFSHDYKTEKLLEYPYLIVEDHFNSITDKLNKKVEKEKEEKIYNNKE